MIHATYRNKLRIEQTFTIPGNSLDFAAIEAEAVRLGLHGWRRIAAWIGGGQ